MLDNTVTASEATSLASGVATGTDSRVFVCDHYDGVFVFRRTNTNVQMRWRVACTCGVL